MLNKKEVGSVVMNVTTHDGDAGFVWTGKQEAIIEADRKPTRKLALARANSVNLKNTKHMILEGDNLEILKIMCKEYENKVRVIYIDPPYNTKKNRMYNDKNSHADWLTMMYPRLYTAKRLLSREGVIFISIGLDEVHRLRLLLDDLFGEENMVSEVVWHSKYTLSNDKAFISTQHEYVLVYAKDKSATKFNLLDRTQKADASYKNPDGDRRGKWKATPLHAKSGKYNASYKFTKVCTYDGNLLPPFTWSAPEGRYPRYSKDSLKRLENDGRITCGRHGTGVPSVKTFLSEVKDGIVAGSLWHYSEVGHTHEANEELSELLGKGVFDNPKPVKLIKRILHLATSPHNHDIVLDFFAGSGTTAHSVLEMNCADGGNRRFICIQEDVPVNKKGYKTMSDITKCRVKNAIALLNAQIPDNRSNDCGFQNYTLKQ